MCVKMRSSQPCSAASRYSAARSQRTANSSGVQVGSVTTTTPEILRPAYAHRAAQNVTSVALEQAHLVTAKSLSIALLSVVAALPLGGARASEGLAFLAALRCEPLRVPRSIIEGCLAAQPALRGKYGTLAVEWTRRNLQHAETLEAQCRAELPRHASTPQQVERLWIDVRQMNDETIREKLEEYRASSGG